MPTNANAYNSRITDETLEKKFRDSFRSQGGAELVDDLYASGVIVPVIDFSAAASGTVLSPELQQAWDFSTGHSQLTNSTATLISNAGFWKVDIIFTGEISHSGALNISNTLNITDGLTSKTIWRLDRAPSTVDQAASALEETIIVFLRSGDSLTATSGGTNNSLNVVYRQIATVSGDLVDPSGFTSS
tara:strand:- start:1426 stop:1989 length:564 start_codon:yes stop_codon:yes gene_type:complete